MNKIKKYDLNQSALYCCRSKKKLAMLLGTTLKRLNVLIKNIDTQYSTFERRKKDGGSRTVHNPSPELKKIQKTMYKYMKKVHRPSWLNSGEIGKSVIDNVIPHENAEDMIKLDISGFFDNCSRNSVYEFFHYGLKQPGDVAAICTDLCTLNNVVVQGSSMSMVIAFYANQQMLEELHELSEKYLLTYTLYVDDIAFSSSKPFNESEVLNKATNIIRKFGFCVKNKKVRIYGPNQVKVLTGVIINNKHQLRVQNYKRKEILNMMTEYRRVEDISEKYHILNRILGKIGAARQIEPNIFNSLRNQLLSDKYKNIKMI